VYAQWQVEQQLQSLAAQARAADMLWYLDFPLGVSGAGYDVWRNSEVFAKGASGGAPPDAFFTKGQNWGFPPLSPDGLRNQEYRYLIHSLRRHLQYARLLRIDHVMSLHRMYWIPDGFDARDGVYVHHRTEELFALLVLESHRHQAEIVGENLGTVPAAVDNALKRHHIRDMYVVQYEAKPEREPPLRAVPELSVASLNTHDMPMFASFWTALDVDDRLDLALLDADEAGAERERRAKLRLSLATLLRERGLLNEESLDPQDVLQALLCWLASSPANIVLVNLEDLWEETQPQNTPGTFRERSNWRRKLRYEFEKFRELPQVVEALAAVNQRRTKGLS
jgi:4-alpha-glucanotransferase